MGKEYIYKISKYHRASSKLNIQMALGLIKENKEKLR
jgi:hypothetical protein